MRVDYAPFLRLDRHVNERLAFPLENREVHNTSYVHVLKGEVLGRETSLFIYSIYNKMPPIRPWILVWDLDETLVTGWRQGWKEKDITVNPNAAFILSVATKLRWAGIVKYIFLLTNNSDLPYINTSIKKISEYIQYSGQLFDDKLINDQNNRTYHYSKSKYNPDKSVRDINYLLKRVHSKYDYSEYRVLFFDDRGDHVLKREIPLEHYIQITPPFSTAESFIDETPWSRVLGYLRSSAKRRNTRKRVISLGKRKTRKN